jgi:hypothetical protein
MSVWIHECGGEVVWDLSGGFCTGCHAEGLDAGDEDVLEEDGQPGAWERFEATVEAVRQSGGYDLN